MYEPEVNDYVIWTKNNSEEKGWVYFKSEEYITLETGIKPRPDCEHSRNPRHKYIHTLLLCFPKDFQDLKYVKSRHNCKSQSYYNRLQS